MGNKIGWILAGVLMTALIGVIVYFVAFPHPSAPKETLKAGMLKTKELTVGVGKVAGFEPSGGGNAGDDYVQAARLAKPENDQDGAITLVNVAVMDATKEKRQAAVSADAVATLERIASHVADGAQRKKMEYFFKHTPKSLDIRLRVWAPGLDGLQAAASGVRVLAEYYENQKQYDKALRTLKDLFVMGRHMIDERAHLQLTEMGMAAQRAAIARLARVYRAQGGNDSAMQALREYEDTLMDLESYYRQKCKILFNTSPYAGDVFNIAENDEDPAWRVQGVLILGIVKFTAPEGKDVKYCEKLIGKLVKDSDPAIAAAANAAQKQTREDHRMLASK